MGLDSDPALGRRLKDLEHQLRELSESWMRIRPRLQGARIALVGQVNAGKSSLFNALVGHRRALVSDFAGTTRDVVESSVVMDGMEVTYMDTAGRRDEAQQDDVEEIEAAGISLGIELIEGVDIEIWVHRLDMPFSHDLMPEQVGRQRIVVGTHLDMVKNSSRSSVDVAVSNQTAEGMDELKSQLASILGRGASSGEDVALFSQRQHDLVVKLRDHVCAAHESLLGLAGVAVAAEELHAGLLRLTELCGGDPREEVLDRLFSRFCIGK